jgi:hypothetical protein
MESLQISHPATLTGSIHPVPPKSGSTGLYIESAPRAARRKKAVMRALTHRAAGALLVLAAVIVAPAGPAQAAANALVSRHDGRCLDSDVATPTHDGTQVQIWQCNGWNNQAWTVGADGTIRSSHDGRCLDEDIAGGTHNGTKVQVWTCNTWDNQKWTFNADGTIRNAHDGRCLDEDIAGGTHNGTRAQVWDCNGGDNQQWHR